MSAAQEAWLERAFGASRTGWNIMAQQTLMARFGVGSGARGATDRRLDGYPARKRL